jgi:hypothetical protein
MKTVVGFTTALTTLVLATAADADVQDRRCKESGVGKPWGAISVRAGTPCLILPWYGWRGHSTEIIEPPHNGTALVRADGSIYYSPKPGFTGRDRMRVRPTDCPHCFLGLGYVIFVE